MADKVQVVDVDFGKDTMAEIEHYVDEQLQWLMDAHRNMHTDLLPKWRKLYLGEPQEQTKNVPWPNAANTVVQVIGESVDTMVARVMGLMFVTHPLWAFKSYAAGAQDVLAEYEKQRSAVENFMDNAGMEPAVLDLQFVESLWFTDAAKLGTAFTKLSLEDITEAVIVGYDEQNKIVGTDETIFSGPRVSNLRHEDFLADPNARTIEDAEFVATRKTLTRKGLEERKFTGKFSEDAVDKLIGQPDRSTMTEEKRAEVEKLGISAASRPESTAEWDIWECQFGWWHHDGKTNRKFSIILHYHKKSKTVLRCVFNFLPRNQRAVKRAKLGYRTDGMYGHGYAELLEIYQEELSTTHNQRLDNATVANVRALRVSPRARALDTNIELYPASLLIGEKDEIESIQVGDVYPSTFKNEEMTLQLVARRAGISPAVSGGGTGGMMKRPQQYSASGTLAVMQENNSVVGQATAEFRHAHVMLGSLLVEMYGKFGTNGMEKMFGVDAHHLTAGLKAFTEQTMRIPIRSSNGGLNREVDKQTGMLMAGVMQRHYTAIGQLMQAIANPMVPEPVRKYFTDVAKASNLLHQRIMKDFGYEQPDIYTPEPPVGGQQESAGKMAQGGMAPGGARMGGSPQAGEGGGGGPVPLPGMGGGQVGPVPPSGAGGGSGGSR